MFGFLPDIAEAVVLPVAEVVVPPLADVAVGTAGVVDDVVGEVTGIRPVEDTIVVGAAVLCVLCNEKSCTCKDKK